jgi:hypothetical protein
MALALSAVATMAVAEEETVPDLPRTELLQYRVGNGPIPVIGTDREARIDAFVRVPAFLKDRLEN